SCPYRCHRLGRKHSLRRNPQLCSARHGKPRDLSRALEQRRHHPHPRKRSPPGTAAMTEVKNFAIDIADINAAAERLRGQAVRTPLLRSRDLEAATGAAAAFIKPEVLQRTGSFKFRGAYNKLCAAKAADPNLCQVVAFSSGNHAQGVAAAAA